MAGVLPARACRSWTQEGEAAGEGPCQEEGEAAAAGLRVPPRVAWEAAAAAR